jgi:hypothetical protein
MNSYLVSKVTIDTEEIISEAQENDQLLHRPEPGKLEFLVS